jgi:hypothetical protein
VESAQNYIQAQPIVGADETGFKQGNSDGQNGKNQKAWLWVAVTPLAIRPAVLWRRVSFGSQSQAGSVFVARMLTVVTSLRSQNRNVLEFMTTAVRASREGTLPPSLLPQPSQSYPSDALF